jgi:hypothetical protein
VLPHTLKGLRRKTSQAPNRSRAVYVAA